MNAQLNTAAQDAGAADRGWLASLVLRSDGQALPRFARTYQMLAAKPRSWRRRLRRKVSLSLGSVALLLALMGPVGGPAQAQAPDAVIQVVNGEVADVDNNKCSLIEAIINARTTKAGQLRPDCTAGNLNGPDTVRLPAGGDFVLTQAHNQQYGDTGLPVITSVVTIDGNGATIRRDGDAYTPEFRHLAVDPDGSLTLTNVTLADGYSFYYNGGAIFNRGQLQVIDCTFSGNAAFDPYWVTGGAISNSGALTISNSRFEDNYAFSGEYAYGGAISSGNTLVISNSVFNGNGVGADAAKGGAVSSNNHLSVTDSVFTDNDAGEGGAVAVFGEALISGSTFTGNTGLNYGFNNYERGGAILNDGTLVVANSTITGNHASKGGGIVNSGQLTLVNSTVTGNTAERGGGVAGANWTDPYGYDDYDCSETTIQRSIISGNTAGEGREVWLDDPGYSCVSTMVVNNFNVFGRSGSHGLHNFNKGATDVVPTVGLSAILGPLANNGGPTQTHALPPNSPALDLAPNGQCTAAPVNGVDQRGEPRNANGKGGVTANECDAGSFELQASGGGAAFLVSPTTNGTVGGVAFTPADILKYDPASGWSLFFDASDVGVTKNLAAFEVLDNGHVLMAFTASQSIPGVGVFTPQDIARFVPTATGPNTAGAFQWELDGSTHGLTTAGEKIDALGRLADGRLALSTLGAASVPGPSGAIKAQDEDALGLNMTSQAWSVWFDGTAVPGLAAEEVNALWVDPATGDVYISIVGTFNVGGVGTPSVQGNGKDIVKLTPTPSAPGGYTAGLWWDGSAAGFPSNVDGLEVLP